MERSEQLTALNTLNETLLKAVSQLAKSNSGIDAGHAESTLQQYRQLLAQASARAKALVGAERYQLYAAILQHQEAARYFAAQISAHYPQNYAEAVAFVPYGDYIRYMTAQARMRLDEGTVTSAYTADEIARQNLQMQGVAGNAEAVQEGFYLGGRLAKIISCTEQKHYIAQWTACVGSLAFLVAIGIWRICVIAGVKSTK